MLAAPREAAQPWPRVSIVTPSFNQAEFVEETIRSVLLQDYPDLEYIVIDGGSRDASARIIAQYAPWLAHWVSEPDRGQSDAINKGWAVATGELLAFVNSDDFYLPGALTAAVEHLLRHPDLGAVYGAFTTVDARGRVLTPLVTPDEWSPELLIHGLPVPFMLFRRSALAQVGFMDIDLHYAMDADLCIRAALGGVRFGRIPGASRVCVREWAGAKSADWSEAGLREVWLTLDRLAASPRAPIEIRSRIAAIKAGACLWPARQRALRGDASGARRLLIAGLRVHWPMGFSREFLRVLFGALLGRRGRELADRMRRTLGQRRTDRA